MSCTHATLAASVECFRLVDDSRYSPEEIKREIHGNAEAGIVEGHDETEPVAFTAHVRVVCEDCGNEFGFRGPMPVGLHPAGPTVSPDLKELRIPLISPTQLAMLEIGQGKR